jgi:nucleoside-diphosphate kinase
MAVERTLMMIKPDATGRHVLGQVIARVEAEGFVVLQLRMLQLEPDQAESFYSVHRERPFYGGLVEFITSGTVVPMVLEREDAVRHLRDFIGVTDSAVAAPGTIRSDFGTDVQRNAVHASDSTDNALREVGFFFGPNAV